MVWLPPPAKLAVNSYELSALHDIKNRSSFVKFTFRTANLWVLIFLSNSIYLVLMLATNPSAVDTPKCKAYFDRARYVPGLS